jgi:hypothetical protein
METKSLQGTPEEQRMAGWIANLFLQRGFSFALNARVELERGELVEYFMSQGQGEGPEQLVGLIESAVGANSDVFSRADSDGEIVYSVPKRKLVELLQPPAMESRPLSAPRPAKRLVTDAAQAAKTAAPALVAEAPVLPPEPRPVPAPEPVAVEAAPAPAHRPQPSTPPTLAAPSRSRERRESPAPSPTAERPAAVEPTASSRESKGQIDENLPITLQYKLAILQALYRLGGSGRAADVVTMIPELMQLPEDHRGTYARGPEGKSEEPKYVKYVHSARRFLIQDEELDSPNRGIWAITDKGKERLLKAGLANF